MPTMHMEVSPTMACELFQFPCGSRGGSRAQVSFASMMNTDTKVKEHVLLPTYPSRVGGRDGERTRVARFTYPKNLKGGPIRVSRNGRGFTNRGNEGNEQPQPKAKPR